MIDSEILAERPAVRVPFAQPFWATLRPPPIAEEMYSAVEMCNEVCCHRFFNRCSSSCELIGMILAIAKFQPLVLSGARLALRALRFELHNSQAELVAAMLDAAALDSQSLVTTGSILLRISTQQFYYGPKESPFHRLGILP